MIEIFSISKYLFNLLNFSQFIFISFIFLGLAIDYTKIKILPLKDFPNGILYHHDRPYMRKLKSDKVHPYGYHMCWTSGKPDKLKFLKEESMWYINELCSPLLSLVDEKHTDWENYDAGEIFLYIKDNIDLNYEEQWQRLSEKCCQKMINSP